MQWSTSININANYPNANGVVGFLAFSAAYVQMHAFKTKYYLQMKYRKGNAGKRTKNVS